MPGTYRAQIHESGLNCDTVRRESTDPIELATDLHQIAVSVVNTAIQQAGSDPMSSLHEGDSKITHSVREFSTDLNRGVMDCSKRNRLRRDLLHSAAHALLMIAMIDSESDRRKG